MSLHPAISTVQTVKDNIASVIQNHGLTPGMRASLIGPQLAIVNEWSDQINLVLDHPEAPAPVNLVFAIRKDLFIAPQYTHCVLLGTELPPSFSAFLAMILKLIGAQKNDKEKPVVKVRFIISHPAGPRLILLLIFLLSLNVLPVSSPNLTSILMMK